MSQDASRVGGGVGAKGMRRYASKLRSPNVIVLSHEQRKTAVDAGSILGDWLVQCLCWQKLKEWGIIG